VVGDVTSTVAGALAADALDLRLSHIEAGLRSGDDTMPEERNRKVTDVLAQRLFASEPAGVANLAREGVPPGRVHLVGNVMIDTLLRFKAEALAAAPWASHGLDRGQYAVATLHRPGNVDTPAALAECVAVLAETGRRMPVLFAVHPRTTQRLAAAGLALPPSVRALPPQDYFDFLGLMAGAAVVLTDSGGAQEETTALGVPCLTMRDNTERPITCERGTSRLVGRRLPDATRALDEIAAGNDPRGEGVPLWDGGAGARIADLLAAAP
jgi:UDP-N-acetylglucosamine 2-epimerase (non-hydrolysing)